MNYGKLIKISFTFIFLFTACNNQSNDLVQKDLVHFVNPLIGTNKMGHTFPGATTPFGGVQLSPETNNQKLFIDGKYNKDAYKYCAGYQYADTTIFGFSHTHFSGTGHSDLGDFIIMPTTGSLKLEAGDAKILNSGYHSTFSHKSEKAEAAYYSVELASYKIKAELTATDRVGFHQYSFPKNDSAHIIFDLQSNIYDYDDKNVWTFLRIENDSTVTGYRQTTGWARTKTVYFAMQFSKKFLSYGHKRFDKRSYNGFYNKFKESENFPEMAGKKLTAYFNFKTEENEKINIKFALSSVSTNGALANMAEEIPHWNFEQIKKQSQAKWNKELNKIDLEAQTPADYETFYTALYHTMLSPIQYQDTDGQYKGLDQNTYVANNFTNYSIFSLWDTYRALHPLFNILQPSRNNNMIKSMLVHYDQSVHKMLPIWSHYNNENWCMIGYHSVSVIADAAIKGVGDFDQKYALKACINTSNKRYYDGIESYLTLGYVAEDQNSNSVSKTLEYAYDDWAIAQLANKLGEKEIYQTYLKRSENYLNVYDKSIGFMRPKLTNGDWKTDFDPLKTEGAGFIEGNAWTYTLFVPHNVPSLINLFGGEQKFTNYLDSLFTMHLDDKYIEHTEDITRDGIIGNYVQGNEPGHHIPYLYNWTSKPWKTQERVRMIMASMYGAGTDGLCGNDDAGQMSAWYIFSALGFYPVSPGSDEYSIGSPQIKNASLHLDNGKTLKIKTVNQSKENVYIEKIELNGKIYNKNYFKHADIINGGEIIYYMSAKHL